MEIKKFNPLVVVAGGFLFGACGGLSGLAVAMLVGHSHGWIISRGIIGGFIGSLAGGKGILCGIAKRCLSIDKINYWVQIARITLL